MTIEVIPLSQAMGAEIRGVDLSKPLDVATVEDIRRAWVKHHVLVFRGQRMTEEDEIRFASHFGELSRTSSTFGKGIVDNPEYVLAVSNLKADGKYLGTLPDGDLTQHADTIWAPVPPRGTMLFAVEVPKQGGETFFANMCMAYDALPDDLKSVLDSHDAEFSYNLGARYAGDDAGLKDTRAADHPATVTHPEAHRRAIFVNRLMTTRLKGLPDEESQDVLERVFAHNEKPEFRYVHAWKPGDFVIWDNLATQHGRNDFDPSERRLMKRVMITGSWVPAR